MTDKFMEWLMKAKYIRRIRKSQEKMEKYIQIIVRTYTVYRLMRCRFDTVTLCYNTGMSNLLMEDYGKPIYMLQQL